MDFIPTLAPTPEPVVTPVNNSTVASPSPRASPVRDPTADPTILPTPLASGMELTRPGLNIGTIFAGLIGLACAGYIGYLGLVIIRK